MLAPLCLAQCFTEDPNQLVVAKGKVNATDIDELLKVTSKHRLSRIVYCVNRESQALLGI